MNVNQILIKESIIFILKDIRYFVPEEGNQPLSHERTMKSRLSYVGGSVLQDICNHFRCAFTAGHSPAMML